MERNTIELMAHTIIINDDNTVIKVPDSIRTSVLNEESVFEKDYYANYSIQENNINA